MNAKRQHWVPKFYLKEFATPETRDLDKPQVWVLSKDQGDKEEFILGIENVALESFLYSPRRKDGTRDFSVENKLNELETLVSLGWQAIAHDFVDITPNSPTRKVLSMFLATMILRHPKQLDKAREVHERFAEVTNQAPKDPNGKPMIDWIGADGIARPLDFSNWVAEGEDKEYQIRDLFAKNIRGLGGEIAQLLMAKRWAIVFSETPIFCTSDNPVVVENSLGKSPGINTKGTTIMFPLSPTRALILDDRFEEMDGAYFPAKPGAGDSFCAMTWVRCHKFIISFSEPLKFLNEVIACNTDYEIEKYDWPFATEKLSETLHAPVQAAKNGKYAAAEIYKPPHNN